MVAPRYATRDLDIQAAIRPAIARNQLADDEHHGGRRHGHGYLQLIKAALQAPQMQFAIQQCAVIKSDIFINPIGELVSPVLHMHCSIHVMHILPVYIRNPCHRYTPSISVMPPLKKGRGWKPKSLLASSWKKIRSSFIR